MPLKYFVPSDCLITLDLDLRSTGEWARQLLA